MKTLILVFAVSKFYLALYKIPTLIIYNIMPNLPKYILLTLYSLIFLVG